MEQIFNLNKNQGNNHRKRIGIMHYTLPPAISGVEMVIRDHARLLTNSGFKVFLLGASGKKFRNEIDVQVSRSFSPKNKKVFNIQENLQKKKINKSFYEQKDKYFKIIKNWIEKNKLDIVITHNLLSRHYNLALTAAIIEVTEKLHDSVKFVTWIHDASFVDTFYTHVNVDLTNIYPWTLISKYQKYTTYITISETRKTELKKLYGNTNKIIVVPNGIDVNKMLPLPLQTRALFKKIRETNPDYTGLIPVRIAERKNIEYAIKFAEIAKEKYGKNFIFIITGALHLQNPEANNYFIYLKQLIIKKKLEKNFFFLYNYKFENGEKFDIYKLNIRDLYLISDFLFLPSKGEGFGLPIIEAGFLRIPIFSSNIPVLKEIGNGYINTFNLEDEIETNIEMVLNILRKSRSTMFHKIILKEYSLETIVREKIVPLLLSLYDKS